MRAKKKELNLMYLAIFVITAYSFALGLNDSLFIAGSSTKACVLSAFIAFLNIVFSKPYKYV